MTRVVRSLDVRLYPSRVQQRALVHQLVACRDVYNAALEQRRIAWRSHGRGISFVDQCREAKLLAKELPERFEGVNAQALQQSLKRLDLAFKDFFGGKSGYPRFKGRAHFRSILFPQPVPKSVEGNRLKVPLVGKVRFLRAEFPPWWSHAMLKQVRVVEKADGWHAIIVCEVAPEAFRVQHAHPDKVLGIDMGLSVLLATSDGDVVENPRALQRSERRLKRLQRRVARKKRGGKNRRKAITRLARLHLHVKRQRTDVAHKVARSLARRAGVVVSEENLGGLARGMLGKSVLDAAWNRLHGFLDYKCVEEGGRHVKGGQWGSSQACVCGASVLKSLSVRVHVCLNVSCAWFGESVDRDVMAAMVLRARFLNRVPMDGGEVTLAETGGSDAARAVSVLVVDAGSPRL